MFQSAPPSRAATRHLNRLNYAFGVSIRAALTGGDRVRSEARACSMGFNPRRPHGRRPERALRELLDAKTGPLPSFATVAEVAQALRLDRSTIYAWTALRGPDGRALLPCREILGRKLIDIRDVLALPATWPSWAPRRPFLFSEEDAA